MAFLPADSVRGQIQRLFGRGPVAGLDDGALLERYASEGDEAAFEAVVRLHGPMVHATCRRMLDDPEEAEDAFQATFLVLVRRATSLGPGVVLGPWLHGVACRVSLRARSIAARRRSRERTGAGPLAVAAVEACAPSDDAEVRAAIDGELRRLPASYRRVVVLCDLEGRTHAEAARQLGWPIGTVKGRLARARQALRSRLARRGIAPTSAGLAAVLASEAGATVPAGWVTIAVEVARRAAAGEAIAGAVSASALALAEGVSRAMRTHVSKLATTTFAALLVAAAGVGASAQKEDRAGAPPEEVKKARRDEPIVERKVAGPQPAPTGPGVEPASGDGTPRPAPTEFDKLAPETRLEKRTEAIRLRLDEPITMSFPNETPLEDVLRYIRSVTQSEERDLPTGIPIYVDPISLQEAEKTLQSPVSLDLEGIPLSRSLHLTLRQLGLTYFVEGGLLVIYCHSSEIRPEDFRSKPPMPDKPSPLEELKQRAERGELDAAQRKDLIQTLRDLKEIDALLHDPYYGKPADHPDNKPGKPSIP